jgi:hypothetical protein
LCRCSSQANRQFASGGLTTANQEIVVETGAFLQSAEEVGNVVLVSFPANRFISARWPKYWMGQEPSQYVFFASARLSPQALTE